jgi:hypothetical protein
MGAGEQKGGSGTRRDAPEDERSRVSRESAGAEDEDIDRREDEGYDQPQSSAQKIPHRQDDQDDVQ